MTDVMTEADRYAALEAELEATQRREAALRAEAAAAEAVIREQLIEQMEVGNLDRSDVNEILANLSLGPEPDRVRAEIQVTLTVELMLGSTAYATVSTPEGLRQHLCLDDFHMSGGYETDLEMDGYEDVSIRVLSVRSPE